MTRAITRILVPTDFSTTSDAAWEFAKIVARTFGASLHLLHVFEDPIVTAGLTEAYAALPTDLRASLVEDASQQLANRLSDEERVRFRATTEVVSGFRSRIAIVEYAQDHQIDLIIMGTHGRTGMSHLFIGSVAERVVRFASCPVLTVRADMTVVKQPERAYLPEMPTQIAS